MVGHRFDALVDLSLQPWHDTDAKVETWLRRLKELVTILPLHDEDAHTALEREITGTPPAKPRERHKSGRGARDAAIWLTVARHHAARAEEGHLLSKDREAFSDGHGELNPLLREDLKAASHDFRLYSSVNAFVAQLGTIVAGRDITLDELREHASVTLKDGLKASLEVPLAVWDKLKPELRYATKGLSL